MFNSRDTSYRSPTGAVPAGEAVHFKITPPRSLECKGAYMIIEADGNKPQIYDMFWCGMNGQDNEWWECHFTPETSGIYFYHFELKTSRGHSHLFRGINGQAVTSSYGSRWQLTSYNPSFTTPDWLKGGIIYQIFPDRFYFSGKEKSKVPTDRTIRENWGETPHWQPNNQGIITNSDYFKGDLLGVAEKLPYLKSLGVSCIYLNPIFEAHSNHRYDTADYSKIDPLLGTEDDFKALCKNAEKQGIKIILDGVFNHTGSDSVYFNRENRYPTLGAFNSKDSPYFSWYNFTSWPQVYESWWNFDTLPNLREENPQYSQYITGPNGIIPKWLKSGAKGWRLDVADELPDHFLNSIYAAAKKQDPQAIVMGEVWEDASNKTAYGIRRRYLLGGQMDTVMNYPFREAILSFLTGGHSSLCMEQIEDIVENYPPHCLHLLMNHIGTHDTERAITILAGQCVMGKDRAWQNQTQLSPEEYETGTKKLRLASLLQFTLPGVPCIYYGDEAGLQGYKDPFNRGCYPWGKENHQLISWYKTLGNLRKNYNIFKNSGLKNLYSHGDIMCFERFEETENGRKAIVIAINRGENNATVPVTLQKPKHLLGTAYSQDFKLPPFGYSVQHVAVETPKSNH